MTYWECILFHFLIIAALTFLWNDRQPAPVWREGRANKLQGSRLFRCQKQSWQDYLEHKSFVLQSLAELTRINGKTNKDICAHHTSYLSTHWHWTYMSPLSIWGSGHIWVYDICQHLSTSQSIWKVIWFWPVCVSVLTFTYVTLFPIENIRANIVILIQAHCF